MVPTLRAQQAAPTVPQVDLSEPSSPVHTQYTGPGGILGEITCDRNGALYIQPQFVPGADTNARATSDIVRINPDGSIKKFSAVDASAPNHPTYVVGHAIDRDGRVFLLTMRPGPRSQLTILQLAPDSSSVSKTDLDREMQPTLFAVLPSGDFLVGGTAATSEQDKQSRASVLWLFGSDGSFHREFISAASSKKTDSKAKGPVDVPSTADLGGLRIGDDDNIYVFRPGSPAKVDVFDQSGARQRTLRLDTPPKASFDHFFAVSGGRLVVGYSSAQQKVGPPSSSRIFRVYDAQTGAAQVDYVSTFRGTPACLDNNDLVFLVTGKGGGFDIARASMR